MDDIGEELAKFAASAPPEHDGALRAVAAAASRSGLLDDLRDTVRAAVEASFDGLRHTELAEVECRWIPLAETFRRRVQARVDAARQAATDLFVSVHRQLRMGGRQRRRCARRGLARDRLVAEASSRGQNAIGASLVSGSSVFDLAVLFGLGALVVSRVGLTEEWCSSRARREPG